MLATDLGARREVFRRALHEQAGRRGVRVVRPRDDRWNRPNSTSRASNVGGKGDAAHWIGEGGLVRVGAYVEPEWAFWIAMHEMGHVALRHTRSRGMAQDLIHRDEVDAWLWALDESPFPVNGYVVRAIEACLTSYDVTLRHWMRWDAGVQAAPHEEPWWAGEYMRETGGVCF